MNCSRREVVRLLLLTAAAGAAPASIASAMRLRRAETLFEWKQVAPGARVAFGQGGNALVLVSGNEALLIDSKNAGFGDVLQREAGAFGHAVTRLVNTHHHADHTGGNEAFTRELPVVAHANAAPRIRSQLERYVRTIQASARAMRSGDAGLPTSAEPEIEKLLKRAEELAPADFAPTETIERERTLRIGELTVELRHAGAGHTDNDVFIFVPELNLLHTGDLVFHRLNPYIDVGAGATTTGWEQSILAMRDLCTADTTVVPGHGEITDEDGLIAQRNYFETVRGLVAAARAEGRSRSEVTSLPRPESLRDYGFDRLWPQNLGVLYDELAAESE